MDISPRYVVDEHDRRVAVQLDLETFARIEEVLENHGLYRLMQEAEADDLLEIAAARDYYRSLDKAD
jgi:hypothetical protein